MNLIHILILSITEGITEFLPISSTGHLVITSFLLGIPQTDFVKLFEITIQLGAILAAVFLYGRLLLQKQSLLYRVGIAFIPTALVGLLFYSIIKSFLLGNMGVTVTALGIGGIVLLGVEKILPKKSSKTLASLSYADAVVIGLGQAVSLIPGVSRAAATIISGLFVGLSKEDAVTFSFLLAIPTMAAVTGLDLYKNISLLTVDTIPVLLLGSLLSAITAYLTMQFLLAYVKKHSFVVFGVYRIILAGILALLFFR